MISWQRARAETVTSAAAEEEVQADPDPTAPPVLSTHERVWGILTAGGPGFLIHGAGHLVAGETQTGWRLLAMEGIGLGSAVTGLGGLALTGASPKTVMPFIGMVVLGVGLMGTSLLADIYGVSAPAGGTGSPMPRPRLEIEVGGSYVDDPIFDYDFFSYQAVTWRWQKTTVLGQAFLGLDHDNQRLRLLGMRELWRGGPSSALWLELGVVHHRFGTERFSSTFGEIALAGRYDLGKVGRTLRGSFMDAAFGYALGANHQFRLSTEIDEMTLARLGFGFYLGHRPDRGGEVSIYYDHRHDDLAAGLKIRGLGSGPAGHAGLRAALYLSARWGLSAYGEIGSAHVVGVSVLHRLARVP